MEPEAEANLLNLETEFSTTDCLTDEEILEKSQALLSQVDQLWSGIALQKSLQQQFAGYMPQSLITQLVQKVIQVADTSVALADQLVQSVQAILPHWQEEDLQVIARPFAYAMRGNPTPEMVVVTRKSHQTKHWADLSEIEQARLGFKAAYTAFSELETLNSRE
ncbi:MAG: hypothetical protein HC920_06435 [Oscillatoriales cyanobacterium SM2_3_0]|nr:hypothetical protein [Oscillatoriales cyanobacterium SM2_3_0]